jgi:chemotaxis protein methyltransferase CheR
VRAAHSIAQEEELVLEYLRAKAGLRIPEFRRSELRACLTALRRRFQICEGDLVRRLEAEQPIFDELISHATVGETYFFRDPVQLDTIRKVVLPSLASTRQNLRVWSAGCSTGEEAYSFAILLEQEGLLARSTILATDISRMALEHAAKGVFKPWSFRQDDPSLAPYFSASGRNRYLCGRLRARVRFAYLNLALDKYPSLENGTALIDLLMCRNVLIYLDESSIRTIASRFYDCLADGGWLITGPSDPPLWSHAPFTAEVVDGAVLYRKSKPPPLNAAARLPKRTSEARRETARAATAFSTKRKSRTGSLPRLPERAEPALRELPQETLSQRIMDVARSEGLEQAAAIAADAVSSHPSSTSLRYLHSLLLMALARDREAQEELRRLIFLDRSLAVAHFTLAMLLQRKGDLGRARRLFENAYRLCSTRSASEIVPLSEGTSAGALAASAKAQVANLVHRRD